MVDFKSLKEYRVKPGSKVNLSQLDPNDQSLCMQGKEDGKDRLKELNKELVAMQEMLYAEHKHKILVVLQAMDTGGKDGTIRHVFERVNPQGVRVASFKGPTPEELDHDYLWRIHEHVPGKGEIVIFNRSHYEDVLIVRVHELVPKEVWKHRYDQINDFEEMLAEEGTTILKFYLHIDKDEQKARLQARLDDPSKHWKFNVDDLKERQRWDEYIAAYEEMLSKTSTECAPWHVIPANRKWYRSLLVAWTLVDALKGLNMHYPESKEDLSKVVIE